LGPQHTHAIATSWLTILLLVPLLGSIVIAILPKAYARKVAILMTGVLMIGSFIGASQFNARSSQMQFEQVASWISAPLPVQYHVGVDGFSLSLVLLTTVVVFLSVLASGTIADRPKLYYSMVMLLTLSILGVFTALDLLQFFVLFELELVPMYFLIAIWGGPRRDYAAMKFLIYTFFGGVMMLFSLLYLYFQLSADVPGMPPSFNMLLLAQRCPLLPVGLQFFACSGFFLAFIIKLPSFPFHTWLPDAHVEAPAPISMILAALLLKMGAYGLVRICLAFFPNFFIGYGPIIMALGAFNIIWAAIACLVQTDMKRIIAFSSVSHMGFVLLGIASLSEAALNGAIFQMISHGLISAFLFFLVGTIYERCHTRMLGDIGGGLARQMPNLFYFWMLAALANLGLPGLSGFVGEVAVFYGSITSWMAQASPQAPFVQAWIYAAAFGVVLTAGYMLWLLKRLFFGPEQPKWVGHLWDARPTEKLIAYSLSALIIVLGIYPLLLTREYTPVARRMAQEIKNRMAQGEIQKGVIGIKL
jgi:proton-translocating NADH-quinone oxidoreductase chain M